MAYTQQTWADGPTGGTPITAARLNHEEAGIADAENGLPGVSVRQYGAKGDGTTDDTSAIQAAINAVQGGAGTAGAAALVFPAGIYLVSSPLVVSNQIAMRGAGFTTELRAASSGMAAVMQVTAGTHHVFSDLRFNGNGNATNAVNQSYSPETSVGTRWVRCMFAGATAYQMVNTGCEDVTYQDCVAPGDESNPTSTPHALSLNIPGGSCRILGGEWFGQINYAAQILAVYQAAIGPFFANNSGAHGDWLLRLDGCYVYDGGVDSNRCLDTNTNLPSVTATSCYFVLQSQPVVANGNMPANATVRFQDCLIWQTGSLPANPASYLLQASGSGRLVIDGGNSVLASGGVLHAFNAVNGATTTTTTLVPCLGVS